MDSQIGKRAPLSHSVCFRKYLINALSIGAVIVATTAFTASEIRTAADDAAFQERLESRLQTGFMHKVFQQELLRVSTGSSNSPSPDVAMILNDAGPHPNISDLHVPLHLRFIELERLVFVHGMLLIRDFGLCNNTPQEVDRLADVQIRQREHEKILCNRKSRARYQQGAHEANLEREKLLIQLKLPALTQKEMISRQRSITQAQDLDIQERFALEDETDEAAENFLQFLDAHQMTAHAVDGRLVLESDADAKRANELLQRWTMLSKQQYKPLREP